MAAVERDDVLSCHFHPELAGANGAGLSQRWITGARAAAPTPAAGPAPGLLPRVVPCLDVQDGRVVKGVRFQDLRDAGDPATQGAAYEAQGADEIVVLDVAASAEARATQAETVARVRAAIRIPLTVGGGVRSVDDARRLLAAGADKVSVNTAAIERPALLSELAGEFGSQCVVLAIDARRSGDRWEALVRGGRTPGRPDAVAWAAEGAGLGAGESLRTSWDRDGTRAGPDLQLARAVAPTADLPMTAPARGARPGLERRPDPRDGAPGALQSGWGDSRPRRGARVARRRRGEDRDRHSGEPRAVRRPAPRARDRRGRCRPRPDRGGRLAPRDRRAG